MNWNVGPWIEAFLHERFSLTVGAGLSVAFVPARFEFDETAQIPGLPSVSARGARSETGWLIGPYVEAGLRVGITDHWSGISSGRFQSLSDFSIDVGGRQARFEFGELWSVILGLSYSF
jgi:hypothetical protein